MDTFKRKQNECNFIFYDYKIFMIFTKKLH